MKPLLSLEKRVPPAGNRTRVEIIVSVLNVARDRVLKTHIMYRANLSHMQLEKYLGFLLENGLLEKRQSIACKNHLYLITAKGLEFLRDYSRLSAHLSSASTPSTYRLSSDL